MVSRTGVPAAIKVLPLGPVTFSETLAVTVPPTLSRRESIESSRAALISVPTGRVRIAAVDRAGLMPTVVLLVSGTAVVSATLVALVVAVVSDLRAVSAAAERTVSTGGVVAVSFEMLDVVSVGLLRVVSAAGRGSLGDGGA